MAWDDDIRVRFPDWGTDAARSRWPAARSRLSVGQVVRGEVIARAPFGVWVDITVGHPALLMVPEMAGARERPITFEDYPPLGAVVEARIVSLGDRAEISLSQHPQAGMAASTAR
jgi:predicted RNA-binding protein with RPS1 domain